MLRKNTMKILKVEKQLVQPGDIIVVADREPYESTEIKGTFMAIEEFILEDILQEYRTLARDPNKMGLSLANMRGYLVHKKLAVWKPFVQVDDT